MDDPKRVVMRYSIGWKEFAAYEDKDGTYVLASDYDRDTQALRKRVDDLITNLDLCKGNELAAQVDDLTRQLAEAQAEVKYLSSSINGKGGFKECLDGEQYYANSLKQQLAVATAKLAVLESDYKDLMKNYHYSHSLCSELKAKLARLRERVLKA